MESDMYKTTTTAPEIRLEPFTGANNGDVAISARIIPRLKATPPDIRKYLTDMGWSAYSGSEGDSMFNRGDIGYGNYMTWEQAVTYCLIKPFLEENK